MTIQVAAHGFELTDELKNFCITQVKEKLEKIACKTINARWVLSLEKNVFVAHLHWDDGIFHNDANTSSDDMYGSIRAATKIAVSQHKRAVELRRNGHSGGPRPQESVKTSHLRTGTDE